MLQRIDAGENSWFLSGLLIGTELEDLVKHTPLDRILVFAPATIALLYDIALNVLDARVEIILVPEDLRERTAVLGHASWLKQTILGRSNCKRVISLFLRQSTSAPSLPTTPL